MIYFTELTAVLHYTIMVWFMVYGSEDPCAAAWGVP